MACVLRNLEMKYHTFLFIYIDSKIGLVFFSFYSIDCTLFMFNPMLLNCFKRYVCHISSLNLKN